MCFIDGQLIGDEKMLLHWAYDVWQHKEVKSTALYQAIVEDFVTKYMKNKQVCSWASEGIRMFCENLRPGRLIIF